VKIMTILGTRPEIIRLSLVIPRLDGLCQQVLVHTGQNYDDNLDGLFFRELGVRQPDHYLGARGSFGEQLGAIMAGSERVMLEERPEKFLVLGDTNSSLAAVMAARLGIPVYHMEAGNRAYDDRVPEEVNRRIIDHVSNVLLPYTERSRANLIKEGIPDERIHVTGNPIYEVIKHFEKEIDESTALKELGIAAKRYFLVTMHRAENVDDEARLRSVLTALDEITRKYGQPVIGSLHPRTRERMRRFGITVKNQDIRFLEPFGFFDFIHLEKNAGCVLTDSGTVQEECCIFKVPNVTIRDVTERPETVDCGSNIIAGVEVEAVLKAVEVALGKGRDWQPPPEYLDENVSAKVARILLGQP
jgi:UDP-N-acetylglucosamine 2-epimerase (non-hydrolysing)